MVVVWVFEVGSTREQRKQRQGGGGEGGGGRIKIMYLKPYMMASVATHMQTLHTMQTNPNLANHVMYR